MIFHQIFHLLNKMIQKKFQEIFLSTEWIWKALSEKNRLINIALEYCFGVTLADFKEIINNDFIQLEAELWMALVIFPGSQTNLE